MSDMKYDTAKPHSIKKFELISTYAFAWAMHLLNYEECHKIIIIDCMSNCGEYVTEGGCIVEGTPVITAKKLYEVREKYPTKEINLVFNDIEPEKIEHLKTVLSDAGIQASSNFRIFYCNKDANELLKSMASQLTKYSKASYLLFYDPFQARIDWDAIRPYLNFWGEVIINHMISDPVRAVKIAKSEDAVAKYQNTYEKNIESLVKTCKTKADYEEIIHKIINDEAKKHDEKIYIASFPFFNRKNGLVFNLIHCTKNITGFNLFKKVTWKTFGGKSSLKKASVDDMCYSFDFSGSSPNGMKADHVDSGCYIVQDIVDYLVENFKGKGLIPTADLWKSLRIHPIFPDDGFRSEIKMKLKFLSFKEIRRNVNGRKISFIDFGQTR